MLSLRKPSEFRKLPSIEQRGQRYNCTHTYARILTYCVTAIIYHIIVNAANACIKSSYIIAVHILSCCQQYC